MLYIVPWKKPIAGDLTGRPPVSVLDEALAPVDREVFRRQVATTRRRARGPAPARCRQACQVTPNASTRFIVLTGDRPMDTFSTVVKFFQDCGLFIYPSALIMALGITISVERYIFLSKARNQNRKVWAQVLPMLQKGQLRDVQSVDQRSPTRRSARSSATA